MNSLHSLRAGVRPLSNWHVAVRVVKTLMNYAQKAQARHVPHYGHIVLCNLQRGYAAERDNTLDSCGLITVQPRHSSGIQ